MQCSHVIGILKAGLSLNDFIYTLLMHRQPENKSIDSLRWLATGVSVTCVTIHINCNRRTIIKLKQRCNVTGTILDRPRAVKPKVTTVGQDRQMTLRHRRRRFKTSQSMAIEYGISSLTVSRR